MSMYIYICIYIYIYICINTHTHTLRAGTKFTSKCEQIKQEEYLGIKVYRFYGSRL